MIKISNIQLKDEGDFSRISAEVQIDNQIQEIYYQVFKRHQEYLCIDKSDGFVLTLLPLAMLFGKNIVVDKPISNNLYLGLTEILMPKLIQMNCKLKKIDIIGERTSRTKMNTLGPATGISMGVDSLFTVQMLKNDLKYLTYFYSLKQNETYDDKIDDFMYMIEEPEKFSGLLEKTFIPVFSNNLTFLSDFAYEQIHTFSNLSYALILQNVISDYYYASAFPESHLLYDFQFSGNYDLLNQKAIQTEVFKMISYSNNYNRVEKTKSIVRLELSKSFLDVCLIEKKSRQATIVNCSRCSKCIRTMVTLDVLGELSHYDKAFDLELYEKKKIQYVADILYKSIINKSVLAIEIQNRMKMTKYKINIRAYAFVVLIGVKNQLNKFLRRFE